MTSNLVDIFDNTFFREDATVNLDVNSLRAVHDLGHPKIGRDTHQRIGIISTKLLMLSEQMKHVQ